MIFFLGIFLRDLVQPWFPFLRNTQLLLEWALTSSVLILAVLVLRGALKGRISCRARYALWAVVLARLLFPFQLSLSLSVQSAADLTPQVPENWSVYSVPVFPAKTEQLEDVSPDYKALSPGYLGPDRGSDFVVQISPDGESLTRYADWFSPNQILQSIWWVGVLIMTATLILSNLHFARNLQRQRRPFLRDGVPLPVYVAEGLPSPCLFGLFRPAVYLTPQVVRDETTLRHVLAHELTHYRHRDHLWSLLRCLCLALHWYNPLVWLAVVLSKRDGELACDEGTVGRLGEAERLPYGRTLVDMAARKNGAAELLSCSTAMTAGKKNIQQRITRLVNQPETAKTALFAALALAAVAVVFTFTAGTAQPANDSGGANQADTSQASESEFLAQAETAQSVFVTPPTYSDSFYPYPITDEDLLAEVSTLLASFQPWSGEAAPVFESKDQLSTYTLSFDGASQSEAWRLCTVDEVCYVLPPDSSRPVGTLPTGTGDSLFAVMRHQCNRIQATLSDLTDEEMAYFNGDDFFTHTPGSYNIRNQFLTSF